MLIVLAGAAIVLAAALGFAGARLTGEESHVRRARGGHRRK